MLSAGLGFLQQTIKATMKIAKPFFEVWIKIMVRTAARDKHGTFYIRAFTAILIPCLLQFPLMAFGQDRADGIDRRLVPLKCAGKCVNGVGAVGDGCNLGGKSGFVSVDGKANGICSISTTGGDYADESKNKRTDDAKEGELFLRERKAEDFHLVIAICVLWWVTAVFLFFPWPWRTCCKTPNVELTGGALAPSSDRRERG